jgi:hypothetical protein
MSSANVSYLALPHKEESSSSVEMLCRVMVETGGGVFVGFWPAIRERSEPSFSSILGQQGLHSTVSFPN